MIDKERMKRVEGLEALVSDVIAEAERKTAADMLDLPEVIRSIG